MKYSVHPDFVASKRDGDVHFIDARQLMHLYGVESYDCLVIDDNASRHTYARLMRRAEEEKLITLRPRYDGNYTIPKAQA